MEHLTLVVSSNGGVLAYFNVEQAFRFLSQVKIVHEWNTSSIFATRIFQG